MPLSRQEELPTTGGRSNQKARTRAAIVEAAVELLREGKPTSVPEAAARARVSVAPAYRYFTSAEDLGDEAAYELIDFLARKDDTEAAIDAAGDDVHARVEALIRELGGHMLREQIAFRQAAKGGLERWFAQQMLDPADRVPVRQGRRVGFTHHALEPIRSQLSKADYERLVAALVVGWGTEAVISLIDVAGLAIEPALEVMVTTCRWILDGALADAGESRRDGTRPRGQGRVRKSSTSMTPSSDADTTTGALGTSTP
jgi:AcrR family transcriptional regulator